MKNKKLIIAIGIGIIFIVGFYMLSNLAYKNTGTKYKIQNILVVKDAADKGFGFLNNKDNKADFDIDSSNFLVDVDRDEPFPDVKLSEGHSYYHNDRPIEKTEYQTYKYPDDSPKRIIFNDYNYCVNVENSPYKICNKWKFGNLDPLGIASFGGINILYENDKVIYWTPESIEEPMLVNNKIAILPSSGKYIYYDGQGLGLEFNRGIVNIQNINNALVGLAEKDNDVYLFKIVEEN